MQVFRTASRLSGVNNLSLIAVYLQARRDMQFVEIETAERMKLAGKKIVIAGGSGFLGISMATAFSHAGAIVTILARSRQKVDGDWQYQVWDGRSVGEWIKAIDGSSLSSRISSRH